MALFTFTTLFKHYGEEDVTLEDAQSGKKGYLVEIHADNLSEATHYAAKFVDKFRGVDAEAEFQGFVKIANNQE